LLRDSVYSYIFLYSTLKEDKNTFKLMQLGVCPSNSYSQML
jgi:hypothetical protein